MRNPQFTIPKCPLFKTGSPPFRGPLMSGHLVPFPPCGVRIFFPAPFQRRGAPGVKIVASGWMMLGISLENDPLLECFGIRFRGEWRT
jgi:hypothetical protein